MARDRNKQTNKQTKKKKKPDTRHRSIWTWGSPDENAKKKKKKKGEMHSGGSRHIVGMSESSSNTEYPVNQVTICGAHSTD